MQNANSKIVDDLKAKREEITGLDEAITLNKTQARELAERYRLAVKQFNRMIGAYPGEASLAEVKAIVKPTKGEASAETPAAE